MQAGTEWLEADGLGGFASGSADGIRTRRYHALLLVQTATGRIVLANGFEAWVELSGATVPITSQRYAGDVVYPDGAQHITSMDHEPWPWWTFVLPDGSTLTQEVFVADGQTNLRWVRHGPGAATLHVRLLLSGRDYHGLHHENPDFNMDAMEEPGCVTWHPYPDRPVIAAWGGTYNAEPTWYRRFLYVEEQARGLDAVEDLGSPGILRWDLAEPATLALRADAMKAHPVEGVAASERTRRSGMAALHRAALEYVAVRGTGQTILAGFPWFTDWGRDSFIALRGLLLTTGRRAMAEQVLLAWSVYVDAGMLPNRFPDDGAPPEYNSVDASLWFVIAVHDVAPVSEPLRAACRAILEGYASGTRFGIQMEPDGLITAGVPGQQLTWMDAKVGDWVVTPRRGKPVEIQALWINALRIVAAWPGGERWATIADRATAGFLARFPDPATGGLRDVVDGDPAEEARVRPNQVFAAGGLPHTIVPPEIARSTIDLVERVLLTPIGLRTLDPRDPAYCPRYEGGPLERDGAYHQGTAWPWLLGPFVEAWLRVRGNTADARAEAATRFLAPLQRHLGEAGLGHISEVADGDAPHRPGGCPFQAWSLGEYLRIQAMVDQPE